MLQESYHFLLTPSILRQQDTILCTEIASTPSSFCNEAKIEEIPHAAVTEITFKRPEARYQQHSRATEVIFESSMQSKSKGIGPVTLSNIYWP